MRIGAPLSLPLLWLLGCGEAEPARTLVVHTSLPEAVLDSARGAFEAVHPGWAVRFVTVSAEATLEALRAGEVVDVWWGGPAALLETAADEGLLASYRPSWAGSPDSVGDGVVDADPEGRWHATLVSPFVIAFHRERVPLVEAPRDWLDLFHHAWWEELVVLDPTRSPAMADFVGGMLVESLREGDLEAGFDWLVRLDRSTGAYLVDADAALRRLRTGEASLTILPRHVAEAARHGDASWLRYRIAESGSPLMVLGVGMGASAAEPELARRFVDVVGSAGMATALRVHTRWTPALGGADPSRLPEDFELEMPWSPYPPAVDTLSRELDGWLARWDAEVRDRR